MNKMLMDKNRSIGEREWGEHRHQINSMANICQTVSEYDHMNRIYNKAILLSKLCTFVNPEI